MSAACSVDRSPQPEKRGTEVSPAETRASVTSAESDDTPSADDNPATRDVPSR